jgi:DUF4097 and DUF4098 domain-containing protein YvlB
MKMSGSGRVLLAAATLVILIPNPAAHWTAIAARTPASEKVVREFALPRGGRLVLQNGRGDISIQAWNRPVIELEAVKTLDAADAEPVSIDIRASDDEVDISSRTPSSVRSQRSTVDYQLRVPADIDLKLIKNARGRVQITGTTGRVVVQVVNGDVRLGDCSGKLDAMTVNGDIDAGFVRVDPGESIKLENFNGDIRLRLPPSVNPHLEARALSGAIHSVLPLAIQGAFGPQSAHQVGDPSAPFVSLVSIRGDIHITHR